jgi:putative ABC transport system permease protein
VAVVNETFARKYLPDEDPIGRRVRLANLQNASAGLETGAEPVRGDWFDIVGVVGDVANRGPQAPTEPEVLLPFTITGSSAHVLIVRASQDPATLANAVRREVSAADPGVPLIRPVGLEAFINQELYASPRFGFLLMMVFGGVGLVLMTLGVYSVLAYSTTQKTHEIGIRMALGAERTNVLRMVVLSGLRVVAVGVAIGLGLSLLLGQMLGTQLVGVTAYDPATLAASATLLTITAVIASLIPARRAARVDPTIALRHE